MQMHMDKVTECVDCIPVIFEHYRNHDMEAVKKLSARISELEHEADLIKHDIRNNLPRGLFLPVDRSNLIRILTIQDSIANRAEDISILLTFKQAGVFEGFNASFDNFLNTSLESFRLTRNIINELDELLETGFGGAEAQTVTELVEKVAQKEHETDVNQRELLRGLLAHENEITYGDFFLWTRVIRQVATIADRSENLAVEIRTTLDVS
jgi:hypothetical protein